MWRWGKQWLVHGLVWWCIGVLISGCQPVTHERPQPTPEVVDGCGLFANVALTTISAGQTTLSLPLVKRRPRYAVHTLFIDETILAHAAELGFDTVVQVLPWRDVNPEPEVWQWETADALVEATLRHNLNLVLRLDMPPAWANQPDAHNLPFNLNAYAAFVARVAARYQGHILGYIIWNEPNLAAEWSYSGANLERQLEISGGRVAYPPHYAGVLGVAYRTIKAADAQALVIAAGLAPTNENSLRAMDDRLFLRQLLASGAADCFDTLAVHSYGYGQDPLAAHTADGLNLARLTDVHAILQEQNINKPLWVTELGYTVHRGSQPAVTPHEQALYLTAALARLQNEWPAVEVATIWNLSYGLPPGDEIEGYSLLTGDVEKRPSYEAVRAFIMSEQ